MQQKTSQTSDSLIRVRIWYDLLLIVFFVFILRLFYLQVIRHDHYRKAALASQLKEYEIPAARGVIEAHDGGKVVPLVLNEKRYTLFADPKFIQNQEEAAAKITEIIGGSSDEHAQKMKLDTRYSVLAKKLTAEQKSKLDELKLKGIGTREEPLRTYPQGTMAAHVLGFVNDEGQGTYGIEQYLDNDLKGTPGRIKAITDAQGVPLVSNPDNIVVQPLSGKKVLLTIDLSMQKRLEELLRAGLDRARSASGSAIIMDPRTGAIKAMTNFPTYNPADFYKIEDSSIFINNAVASPLEVGSIMKPLTVAAGLDKGVINLSTTYFDSGFVVIGDRKITNVEEVSGSGTRSVLDILQLSLNTGAVFVLQQFGGGDINEQARVAWHDYMTAHYGFGQPTGVEQGYEAEGMVPDPKSGYGLGIQYANTSFGQGVTITPLQMAAAFSSAVNGGTHYRPRLVDKLTDSQGKVEEKKPEALRTNVISSEVSKQLIDLLLQAFKRNHRLYGMPNLRPEFIIGGKTGTAQIPSPGGGYYPNKYNGTFVGFVGGDEPEYVIFIRVDEPKIPGYAGLKAAAPIFIDVVNTLIDNFGVKPKGV